MTLNNDLFTRQRQYEQASLKFFQALISNQGIQNIFRVGFEVLGNPIFAVDAALKLIGHNHRTDVEDSTWQNIIGKGYVDPNLVKTLNSLDEIKKLSANDVPQITTYPLENIRMEHRIAINDRVIGYAAMIEYDKSFSEEDVELFRVFCDTLACELQKESHFHETKGIAIEFLLADILDNRIESPALLQDRVQALNLKLQQNLYVVVIRYEDDGLNRSALIYLRDLFATLIDGSIGVLYQDAIVLLLDRKKNIPMTDTDFLNLKKSLKEHHLVSGISRRFHKLADLRIHYEQAVAAIELGPLAHPIDSFYTYDKLAFYHLINLSGKEKDLKKFCDPLIFELLEYDEKNKTEFSKSLYEYLISGSNAKSTAFRLGIHRNTMDYRIRKIEEILNINLSNPSLVWSLYCSFKVFEVTGDIACVTETN